MESYRATRYQKGKLLKKRRRKLIVIFLVVLVVGMGVGVGMNFVFGEPGEQESTAKKDVTDGDSAAEKEKDESAEEESTTSKKPDSPKFKLSEAMSHIYTLSVQMGARPAGSVREANAANYIVQKLGEYGYTVQEQPFTMPDGFGSRNIIGIKPGTREGYKIVIGAHYDSAQDSPGAVNNASGVGVVLELARVFSEASLEPSLEFVFLGANLPGREGSEKRLWGARRFVEMLGSMEKKDIAGMICVDCVAQGEFLALRSQETGTGTGKLLDMLEGFAKSKGLEAVSLKAINDSDNIPFEDAEIPAVWVEYCNSGGELPGDDSYESVLAGKVETAGILIEEFLYSLKSDDLEELRY